MRSFFAHMVEKALRVEAVEPRPGLMLSSAFQLSFVFWRRLPHKYRQEEQGEDSKVTFGKL